MLAAWPDNWPDAVTSPLGAAALTVLAVFGATRRSAPAPKPIPVRVRSRRRRNR